MSFEPHDYSHIALILETQKVAEALGAPVE
jgi:hypothetical protein